MALGPIINFHGIMDASTYLRGIVSARRTLAQASAVKLLGFDVHGVLPVPNQPHGNYFASRNAQGYAPMVSLGKSACTAG